VTHQWYIIHTMSGSEKRIKQMIFDQAAKKGMSDLFEDVVIPVMEVPEVKRGKHVQTEKKFMPGYILVKMDMTDAAWHLVKSIPRVTGFLGNGPKPQPVSEREVKSVLSHIESKTKDATSIKTYEIGEQVTVIDGPFESFCGVVEDVDHAKSRLRVAVLIFGRSTPLDLDFTQIKKTDSD
jgi:transcriptional antiterminator NusG